MKRVSVVMIALSVICGAVAAAPADEGAMSAKNACGLCDAAESGRYGAHAAGTLGRGLTNALLGWTELIAQPVHSGQSGGNVFEGLGKGVGLTIKRFLLGAGEVLIFWAPAGSPPLAHDCALGTMGLAGR